MSRRHPYRPTQADIYLEALRATGADSYRCHPSREGQWTARCPCCGHRSLVVQEHGGRGGRVTLRCGFGCAEEAIRQRLLYPERCGECGAVHGQTDELARAAGELLDLAHRQQALLREQLALDDVVLAA